MPARMSGSSECKAGTGSDASSKTREELIALVKEAGEAFVKEFDRVFQAEIFADDRMLRDYRALLVEPWLSRLECGRYKLNAFNVPIYKPAICSEDPKYFAMWELVESARQVVCGLWSRHQSLPPTSNSLAFHGIESRLDASPGIFYKGFINFSERTSGTRTGLPESLRRQAGEFVKAAWNFYHTDSIKMSDIISMLSEMLGDDIQTNMSGPCQRGGLISISRNGHTIPLLIVETKDRASDSGKDPYARAVLWYRNLWRAGANPYPSASCCPTFLLSLTDDVIDFSGAVCPQNYVAAHLTESVRCTPRQGRGEATERLAVCIQALKDGIVELKSYYDSVHPQGINWQATIWPFLRSFISSETGKPFHLKYTSPKLLECKFHRGIFKAELRQSPEEEASEQVMVKFTRRYCYDAHALLARAELAPTIYHYESLGSGLFVVVMKAIEGPDLATPGIDITPGILADLKRALAVLHANNWVFGDLRRPNIMQYQRGEGRDGAVLVDFDWAGKHEETTYPSELNPAICWPEGVEDGGIMRKEHDLKMLEHLEKNPESVTPRSTAD